MTGKCRPSLRKKTLRNVMLSNLSVTDKECILAIFERYEAKEERHGRWTMSSNNPDKIICTNCNIGFYVWKHEAKDFNYCPNCGTLMDLEG